MELTKVISLNDECDINIVAAYINSYMNNVVENSQTGFFDCTADREFERQFNTIFPYLRLFLRKVSYQKLDLPTNPTLIFTENSTIKELSDKLLVEYGREVIFQRYTINTWLTITQSIHWTLKNQNKEASKLSCLNRDF